MLAFDNRVIPEKHIYRWQYTGIKKYGDFSWQIAVFGYFWFDVENKGRFTENRLFYS